METNVIRCGDCLSRLKEIPGDRIDLAYIDPPFNSQRSHVMQSPSQEKRHFSDKFEDVSAYISYMKPRLV
ncbi:MAG: hypothetical protein JXA01_00420, partial [Dehalococcoidia bacterium]|nr:hypothetical protein [Dehalococcoidia bacterium]